MTKEEFKELEILVGGLSVITEQESTRIRAEKMLEVLKRDKQLLTHCFITDECMGSYCPT